MNINKSVYLDCKLSSRINNGNKINFKRRRKKCIQHLNFNVHQTLDSKQRWENHKSFLCTFISLCRIFLPCGMLHNRVVFEFFMFVYSFLNISFIHVCKKKSQFQLSTRRKKTLLLIPSSWWAGDGEKRDQMSGNCI